MVLRNLSIILFSLAIFSIANTAENGMGSDTSVIIGTVKSVNLQDSMIVLNTENKEDTVYFNSDTEFSTENTDQLLRLDTRIRVKYVTDGDRKIATRIEPESAGENPPPQEDTGTTAPGDEEEPVPPFPDGGTPPLE